MPSPRFVGLRERVTSYAEIFVPHVDDLEATVEDQIRAVAFRILASAAMEEYVEERCKEVAQAGIARLKKGLPTTAGRALVVWAVSRNNPGCIPLREADVSDHFAEFDSSLTSYASMIRSNHGLNRKDALNLLNPVGLREHQLPDALVDSLQALAERRDSAVHTAARRAKHRTGISVERQEVFAVLNLLELLDSELTVVIDTFPVVPAA